MKPALALLLIVGLLFALTAGWGVTRTRPTPDPAALEEWASMLSLASALPARDLFGACVQQDTITVPPAQTCQINVRASDSRVRRARFSLGPSSHIRLVFNQPDNLTVKKELGPTQRQLDLNVFEKGGKLSLTCLVSNPCQVKLLS